VVPNGSFFPPISLVAPAPAESFDKQLGAGPIDLKARLKCPGADPNVTRNPAGWMSVICVSVMSVLALPDMLPVLLKSSQEIPAA